MNKTSCQVQNLAEEGPTRVGYCEHCQIFHLQFGYMTLHLNPEAFLNLGSTINTALAIYKSRLESVDDERTSAVPEIKSALH